MRHCKDNSSMNSRGNASFKKKERKLVHVKQTCGGNAQNNSLFGFSKTTINPQNQQLCGVETYSAMVY